MTQKPRVSVLLALATVLFPGIATTSAARAADGKAPAVLGRKSADFSLRDQYGKPHTLADYADRKIVVLAFLGNECPLVTLYAGRLEQIHKEYGTRGVAVLGINANRQDALTEVATFARRHDLTFPLLKDAGNTLADQLGAERTPQVFVLDGDRVVRYVGRIDDQYGIGFQRPSPTRTDLTLALDELLAGQAISVPVTEAPGCLIGRVAKTEPHGAVTYANQIARLLNDRCVQLPSCGGHRAVPLDQL